MKLLTAVPLISFITACAGRAPVPSGPTLGRYNFNYSLEKPARTGLIQVFDDGEETFLRFLPTERHWNTLSFRSAGNEDSLEPKRIYRNTVVLPGIHDHLLTEHAGKGTVIKRVKVERIGH